ncbi:hypothetical protein EI555_000617 [Monodon monoceros]|uniref:Uncharacterized protein n=1 Tax=Monodon monoceros TaxID=40151 RepID=A0A4U1F3M6_MONMO|nr:hypothetical protein EI555_000617 [Monodon monoceros]
MMEPAYSAGVRNVGEDLKVSQPLCYPERDPASAWRPWCFPAEPLYLRSAVLGASVGGRGGLREKRTRELRRRPRVLQAPSAPRSARGAGREAPPAGCPAQRRWRRRQSCRHRYDPSFVSGRIPESGQAGGKERKPLYGSWPHFLPPILRDFNMRRTRAQMTSWIRVGSGRTTTPPPLLVFFLDTASLTAGAEREADWVFTGVRVWKRPTFLLFSCSGGARTGLKRAPKPERPELAGLRAAGEEAFAGWIPCLAHCSR